jgi:hypothetical protein
MAHFSQLDENNIVIAVLVVDNKDLGDLPFPESEAIGQKFLSDLGVEGNFIQSSYNNNFRGIMGHIGFLYDSESDKFINLSPTLLPIFPEESV